MKQLDDIPAFCRIPQAERNAAWERNPPKAMPVFNDTGRASNLTEHDRAVIAELEAAQRYTVKDALKDEKAQEFFAKKEREREELAAVQAAVAVAVKKPKKPRTKERKRKNSVRTLPPTRHAQGAKRKKQNNVSL